MNDGEQRPAAHVLVSEASALANAARELLRAGLALEARGLVERLAVVLDGLAPRGRVVDLEAERAARRSTVQ